MDITNKKILICDDSVLARKQLMDAVKEIADGAIFLEGRNGTEAIELYKKEKPDIVFMDIVMPEKDGNEALSEIKAFDQDAVIIIVSSVGTQDQLKKAIQLGAKDFIQKPFEKNQISEIIELRLGGK
ncbi:MAG: response regulator [Pseudobutyrivibrio sp.]|jgi:two-component system chemotaxis response regulator CheY|uniref:Stage 0 sporulation protein A homolog n=2 Tax=Pseudobutyrivibrio TaxID=46205 RepID=A0A2G3DS76_9FIRM|nr:MULTISPECIES: response regulator [Pseudobutyrivibrio]MBP5324294.1 response regulator [Pseudobutyrivibrio sp.]MBP5596150.1 response regulator [Pseudobutyrivibrio sp.]MBQ7468875.1 response regulator [Pseudobutyrivibrio sp.]MBR5648704.1 response regulator [Pseudobutyrivibrio sp.]NEX02757.1 response regulator [Pseudobutyrivibrio xylanivorans]